MGDKREKEKEERKSQGTEKEEEMKEEDRMGVTLLCPRLSKP